VRVAILGAGIGWHTRELQRALLARGHACAILPIAGMRAGIGTTHALASRDADLDSFDAVLVRIIPRGSLDQTIFRMDALHLLEARGVAVINAARAIERTVDKFYTSGLLQQAGLPTPRTIVCERSDDAIRAFADLGGDVIVKPLFGSMGLGMARIEDEDVAYRVFKALELERSVYYLQQTIAHGGRDIRAFVLGGRVLAAMERRAPGWRTNVARGATARPIRLTGEQEALCLQAAAIAGAEYAGVDLLESSGEPFVLEVNGVPGWQGLQTTTAIDIADAIVTHIESIVMTHRDRSGRRSDARDS
jgi:RimK family alpha-L-glutamate ligase